MIKDDCFSSDLVQPGSLIAAIDEENENPVRLGLVVRKTGNDLFDVRFGPEKHQVGFVSPEKAFMLVQTDGKFTDPREAFEHHLLDIVLELVIANRLSRELREIKRLKVMRERLDRKLKHRIGRGLLDMLGKIPIIGGRKKTP